MDRKLPKRRVTNLGGTSHIGGRNGTNQIGWGISINLRQYGFITPNLVGYFQVKKMKAIYGYGPLNWNGFGWKRKLF